MPIVVSDAEEALVQEQLEQLHDHHSEAHEDDIVSIALPAADGEEDIFGLAGTARRRHAVDRRRLRAPVPAAVDLEDRDLRARARGQRPRGDPAPRRRRAVGRPVQLHHLRRRAPAPAQPDDQRRGARRGLPRRGRLARGEGRADPGPAAGVHRRPGPRGGRRPARRPARLRRPQPRDQLPHALAGDDLRRHRGQPRGVPVDVLGAGHHQRALDPRRDARERRGQPAHRRARARHPPRPRRRQRDDDLRDVRRHRRVGHRRRHPGEERGVGRDRRGDAGTPGARDVLARPRRARQLRARPGGVPRAVRALRAAHVLVARPDPLRAPAPHRRAAPDAV